MFFKLEGCDIPLVTIGTSPFIGAGQFGSRAPIWREKFLTNPDLMAELMIECYNQGGRGVEAIPAGNILDAFKIVKDQYPEFILTGSTYWNKSDLRIDELARHEAALIFIHGAISDPCNLKIIKPILKQIREAGAIPGIASHQPKQTIPFVEQNALDCPIMLIPFNGKGFAMGAQISVEELVDSSELKFIAMKTLAAGSLRPQDAFNYVANHAIAGASIGMVSVEEIRETVPIALNVFQAGKSPE